MVHDREDELTSLSLAKLSKLIEGKQVSPVEVTEKLLDRIDEVDKDVNAYITVLHEDALKGAVKAEKEIMAGRYRGPLHGVPLGLKDLIYTKGVRTTMGSEIYKDHVPTYDATVTRKLKEAGAILIGKHNTHQFAYGPTGDRSYFGPVKNPHDQTKMSGGSSSGSAAAVARNLCYGALGSDTSGSIRIPASFCGTVGMKPTFGRVSKYGVFPVSWTLDHVGPITKNVEDNAILLNALIGYDSKDPYSVQKEEEDFTRYLQDGIEGTVIGIPSTYYFENLDPVVQRKVLQALKTFEQLGATVREIDIPDLQKMTEAQHIILKSEAYAVHEKRLQEFPDKWDDEVKERLFTGVEPKAYEYALALQTKHYAQSEFQKVFSEVDVVVAPSVAIPPPDLNQRQLNDIGFEGEHIRWPIIKLTGHANFAGFPSLSIPCGMTDTGLPIGLQLMGQSFDEANLYRMAHTFIENTTILSTLNQAVRT